MKYINPLLFGIECERKRKRKFFSSIQIHTNELVSRDTLLVEQIQSHFPIETNENKHKNKTKNYSAYDYYVIRIAGTLSLTNFHAFNVD